MNNLRQMEDCMRQRRERQRGRFSDEEIRRIVNPQPEDFIEPEPDRRPWKLKAALCLAVMIWFWWALARWMW